MRPKYRIDITWSDEEQGFIATVPALFGCCAWGASVEAARFEAENSIESWLEDARNKGWKIPKSDINNTSSITKGADPKTDGNDENTKSK